MTKYISSKKKPLCFDLTFVLGFFVFIPNNIYLFHFDKDFVTIPRTCRLNKTNEIKLVGFLSHEMNTNSEYKKKPNAK